VDARQGREKAIRKLIGALAGILVLVLAEDLHAMPLGEVVSAVSTFSPVEKITCGRPYCPPARHRIICGRYGCWCDPCGRYRIWQNPWDRRWLY
jgi:hypothetical protein